MSIDNDDRESSGPPCEKCGATMVLVDREPHLRISRQEMRIYACPACDRIEVLTSPTE